MARPTVELTAEEAKTIHNLLVNAMIIYRHSNYSSEMHFNKWQKHLADKMEAVGLDPWREEV